MLGEEKFPELALGALADACVIMTGKLLFSTGEFREHLIGMTTASLKSLVKRLLVTFLE